jgi:putative tricarboxylic transport membrane protein
MMEQIAAAAAVFGAPGLLAILAGGALLGVVFGALPGLGTITALAMVLPFTFAMDPVPAMLLYAGIISSGAFGGSIPAILLNTPGTPPNAATCLDGYPMSRRGESGRALAISALSCFVGSLGGVLVLLALLPVVKRLLYAFGPPEMFWLVMFGMVTIALASRHNLVKGLAGGGIGILLATVGYSDMYGVFRYTGGSDYLWDGIPLVPFVVGMLAASELIALAAGDRAPTAVAAVTGDRGWSRQIATGLRDVLSRPWLALRSCAIGAGIGILPGVGAVTAAFLSYAHAQRSSRQPGRFGHGSPEGIIASEVANDAKDGGALLPTVAFGVPGSPDMVLLLGAFIMQGLQPGPELLDKHLDIVLVLAFGIVISQVFCSGLGLLAVPWLARLAAVRHRLLVPFMLVLICIGSFVLRGNILDVVMVVGAGLFGYLLRSAGFPVITVVMGFVLGPLAERAFLQSLMISDHGLWVFFERPIALLLMGATALSLALALLPWRARRVARDNGR